MKLLKKIIYVPLLLMSCNIWAEKFSSNDAQFLVNRNVDICGKVTEIAPSQFTPVAIYIGRNPPFEHIRFYIYPRVYDQIKSNLSLGQNWCAHGFVQKFGPSKYSITIYNQSNIYQDSNDGNQPKGIYEGLFDEPNSEPEQ